MTREEIIDFCEMKSQLEPENEDIFNYIIKALEQEPKSETVTEFADRCRECGAKYGKLLKQEPKTGHWIRWYEQREYDCGTQYIPHCKCSECGREYDSYSSQFIKYCNECGAKMQEVENDT